ncbi:16S rRNA (uracil(1498)-N(3))-methyltransferase [Patescibacteria group bacterium]|nr:MAG: 16S rRNA (uracil(1498)-N(3))-methyltransferase [Patescibacteria group bacterium]
MKIHRFFVEEEISGKERISLANPELLHQMSKVFRFQVGDTVILFNGTGSETVCEITLLTKKVAEFSVLEKREGLARPKTQIALYLSLIKKDNFEWVLQKGTELGVTRFVPVISERSEKKDLNMARAKKIVVEATEQSGWANVPEIGEPVSLADILEQKDAVSENLVAFHLEGTPFEKSLVAGKTSLGILIGPEGGFSEKEIELFKSKNIPIYSLGKQTLRAETAAVAIASLLLL